jgi:hypothetical protein
MRPALLQVEGERNYPVFIRTQVTEELRTFLLSSMLRQTARRLIRHDDDSLHFRVGCAYIYFRPDSERDITDAIEVLTSVVGPFTAQRESWNLAALPREFQNLAPLIRKWPECDDVVRSDLVHEATDFSLSGSLLMLLILSLRQ